MDIFLLLKAALLGVVEGVTEFLPISSTGYLILSVDLLDFWSEEQSDLFIVVIQLGAILAVVYEYFARLWDAFIGLLTGKSAVSARPRWLGASLLVATVPVMVLGLWLSDYMAVLFHPLLVAVMLIIGAFLIIYVEKNPPPVRADHTDQITFKMALWVGACQCLALLPGTSRSGATIIGGVYGGLSKKVATEFSFFLGIPVIIGAGLLDLLKYHHVFSSMNDWLVLLVGSLVSFVVALVCIRWLVAWVADKDLMLFAYLRIVTGVFVLLLYVLFGYSMEA